jgi:molybdenum cofactor cytidylyltransferase
MALISAIGEISARAKMDEIAAIILAAGRSTRFSPDSPPETKQQTKLLAALRGKPLVRHVAESALASRARPIIVVTGHAAAGIEAALADLDVRFVFNPDYRTGLSSSLQAGIAALQATPEGALILLADMPFVSGALIDQIIATFELAFGASAQSPLAAAPVRAGQRGNPVLIGRDLFGAIASLQGDRGARALVEAAGRRVVECMVDDDAVLIDIDRQAALRRLEGG